MGVLKFERQIKARSYQQGIVKESQDADFDAIRPRFNWHIAYFDPALPIETLQNGVPNRRRVGKSQHIFRPLMGSFAIRPPMPIAPAGDPVSAHIGHFVQESSAKLR